MSDPLTGDQKTHTETRDGDVVKGQYSFVDSDGSVRVVKYTADSIHGFQAVVETIPPHVNTVPVAEIRHAPVLPSPVPDFIPHHPTRDEAKGRPNRLDRLGTILLRRPQNIQFFRFPPLFSRVSY